MAMTNDEVWADTVHDIVSTSAPRHGLDPDVLLDVELDDDGTPVGEGVDFAARLDHLADLDPADETFVGAVEEAVAAHAEPDVARANEGGGSGSARQYKRDAKGTSTGGQFTAGSAQTSSKPMTNQGTYKPQAKKGGGGSASTAPAASSKFKTLAPGADNDPQAITEMQQLLTSLGFGNLSSGIYDKATEDAVSAAQQRLGIKPNGKANKSLVNKMLNAFDLSPCIKRSDDGPVLLQIERADRDDDPSIDEILAMAAEDEDEATRAAGHDVTPGHDELHHYWVAGPGLARWASSPKPWTTLLANLVEVVKDKPLETLKKWASRWFIEHFGFAAGSDLNRVTHGKPPRGHVVGPG